MKDLKGYYNTFKNSAEREEALYELCLSSNALPEAAIDELVKSGFLEAPASTRYHGSYAGGLFDHSYNVASILLMMTSSLSLKWANEDESQSPVRIGILHDLCKMDQYIWNPETGTFSFNENTLLTGHGDKSLILAQRLPGVCLNEEEMACIVYHMGAFTEKNEWKNYTNAVHTYPNVLWTHTADMAASHILEVS